MRVPSKYILVGLIYLTGTGALHSQQKSYTLSGNESGSTKSYKARDYVSFLPGFKYAASGNNTFTANIDPRLLFPPTENLYATADGTITDSNNGGIVGLIPGQFNVGLGGEATYNIPVECPPGINGMQPQISLVYNSQSGDGPLGIGWSLSGLSSISSVTKTLFSNSAISGIDLSKAAKQYALDGNTLFSTSTIYGGNGCVFYTEKCSYDLIQSFGSIYYDDPSSVRLPTFQGPEYFQVTTKDSTVMEYKQLVRAGSTTTTAPYKWLISKIIDSNGNYMTFTYTTNNRLQTVISHIDYTANKNGALPYATIKFNYEVKNPVQTSYINGLAIENALLLNSVEVISNGEKYRTYDFSYVIKRGSFAGFSWVETTKKGKYYLQKVTQSTDNGIKLNPTVFTWDYDATAQNVQTCSVANIQGTNTNYVKTNISNWQFISGDIDGDGFSDIIQAYKRKISYYNSSGDETGSETVNHLRMDKNGLPGIGSSLIEEGNVSLDIVTDNFTQMNGGVLIGEFNGDQKKAILVPTIKSEKIYDLLGIFKKWDYYTQIIDPRTGGGFKDTLEVTTQMPAYAIADINNDGRDELISVEKERDDNAKIVGKIFSVKKVLDSEEISAWDKIIVDEFRPNIGSDVKDIFVSDYDGDGLKDILLITTAKAIFLKNQGGTLGTDNIIHVTFFLDSNSGFLTTEMNSGCSAIKPGDFNGDGLMDFLVNEHCSSVWKFLINNGKGFTKNITSDIKAIEESFTERNDDKDDCIVVDLDRDGKSDIIVIDAVYNKETNIWGDKWGTYDHTDVSWYLSTDNELSKFRSFTITDENYYFKKRHTIGDFNGDGYGELLTYDSNIYTGDDASDGGRIYFFNTQHNSNKIVGITDGLNNNRKIEYQLITYDNNRLGTETFYEVGSGSSRPIIDLKIPFTCVNKETFPDGIGGTLANEYSYSGLKGHFYNGLVGFSSITIKNKINNSKKVLSTKYDSYCFMPKEQTIENYSISDNKLTSKSVNYLSNAKTSGVIKSLPLQTIENDILSGVSKTTDYLNFDNWGNPLNIRTTLGTGAEKWVTNVTAVYGKISGICPNKVISSSSTATLGDDSNITISSFSYNGKGNMVKEITDSSDVNQLTIEYSNFNDFGNARLIKKTANGRTRTSEINYSTSGRFVKSKKNILGETTSFIWDEANALLLSEDNRAGTKAYEYDKFGKVILTILPNKLRISKTTHWAGANNYGAKFREHIESSGSAPKDIWYDALGRPIVEETIGLNDKIIYTITQYRSNGSIDRVSEPSFNSIPTKWASFYGYDKYGRVDTLITQMGTTLTTYNELLTKTYPPTDTYIYKKRYSNGLIEYTNQNGKTVNHTYYASGKTKSSAYSSGRAVNMVYDKQGNVIKTTDPDAGITESRYDGFGGLLWSCHALINGVVDTTKNVYDPTTGLIKNIIRSNDQIVYEYDNYKRIKSIEKIGQCNRIYSYDAFDRIKSVTDNIGEKSYTTVVERDAFGRSKKDIFPSGYSLYYVYDKYGNTTEVKDQYGSTIYKPLEMNAMGQLTKEIHGTKELLLGYDKCGFQTSIFSKGIVNNTYFYNTKGNLEYRQDSMSKHKEDFIYDELNRLKNWSVYKNGVLANIYSMNYDDDGNIQKKSTLDNLTMNYGEGIASPHAITSISGKPDMISNDSLDITYTNFGKASTLSENDKLYTISYGLDDKRIKSVYSTDGTIRQIRYYLDDYEEEIDSKGNIRKIHYLPGGAILIRCNGKDSVCYRYNDNQGSIIALTDESGKVLEQFAYDPWGQRRDPSNWTVSDTRKSWLINRGYTCHEHLDDFSVINMNGRLYDPLIGAFFNPDPQLQNPENWLNYNRYSYCYNNPLSYTDPSGEFIWVVPSVNWSDQGGVNVGLTVGIGDPFDGSLYTSVNYGFKHGDFSVALGASMAGFSVYGGWGNSSGWFAGASMGLFSPGGNLSSNIFSIGVSYSQHGGLSGNYMAMQFSNIGTEDMTVDFDPSLSYSLNLRFGTSVSNTTNSLGITTKDQSIFKNQAEMVSWIAKQGLVDPKTGVYRYLYATIGRELRGRGYTIEQGRIKEPGGEYCGGVTLNMANGLNVSNFVYMSPHDTYDNFSISLNHELIHAYHFTKLAGTNQNKINEYSEYIAYSNTNLYHPISIPTTRYMYGPINDIPRYLINIPYMK